jgi:hypothetical protein
MEQRAGAKLSGECASLFAAFASGKLEPTLDPDLRCDALVGSVGLTSDWTPAAQHSPSFPAPASESALDKFQQK